MPNTPAVEVHGNVVVFAVGHSFHVVVVSRLLGSLSPQNLWGVCHRISAVGQKASVGLTDIAHSAVHSACHSAGHSAGHSADRCAGQCADRCACHRAVHCAAHSAGHCTACSAAHSAVHSGGCFVACSAARLNDAHSAALVMDEHEQACQGCVIQLSGSLVHQRVVRPESAAQLLQLHLSLCR